MLLNYKQYGKEYKTLVILHGLMGSLDNWQGLAKRWSEHFPVYVVDQRNHGRSPKSEQFNYDVMVEDLREFCHTHDLREINLLGHSMGGKVAMLFALKYPDLVEKLIVADIGPKSYEGKHEPIFEGMRDLPLDRIESRIMADEMLSASIPNASVRQFILKNLARKEQGDGYEWRVNLEDIVRNYPDILKFDAQGRQFLNPTLFIKGVFSDYIDQDEFDDYRKIFPNAALKTIEGAGHWLHADHPDLVYISVKVFAQLKQKEASMHQSSQPSGHA